MGGDAAELTGIRGQRLWERGPRGGSPWRGPRGSVPGWGRADPFIDPVLRGDSVKDMTRKFDKLNKFEGQDFLRWQKKMHFLLTTLKVVYVLSTPMPVLPESVEDEPLEATRRRSKWENDDYICRGHILNGMSDSLFDIYQNFESAKELCYYLAFKYMAEDVSSKKFLVSNFMGYKMDFKQNLKHNKEELNLTQLGSHLRIEESIRTEELDNNPKGKNQISSSSVNMLEGESSKNPKKSNGKKKDDKYSNKKAKLVCWNCNKPSHFKKDCHLRKVNKDGAGPSGSKDPEKQQGQISVSMQNSKYVQNYISVISEAFYVQDDDVAWWVDSGATSHICKDLRWFKECQPIEDGLVVKMANVATEPIKGLGSASLYFTSGNDKYILSRHGSFMGFGYVCNGMIRLNINYPFIDNTVCMASTSTSNNFNKSELWHDRLGHIHYKRLKDMSKMSLIPAFDMKNNEKCKTCMLTKITRQPFKDVVRESKVLDLIHSDLCDFHATPSLGNKKYVVTFIDDASRYCYVYLLHSKDAALNKFKIYKLQFELHKNELIKVLRTDRVGEYYDQVYFDSTGIINQTTTPYTPQQNGVAERKNRTLKEMVNSMLSYSGLNEGFWGEAMLTACYILNRTPNKRSKNTPYELRCKKVPNLSYLKVWGCREVVRLTEPKRKTLGERGVDCIFIGYAENSKAYRFYVIESNDSVSVNTVIESRDTIFDEERFTSIPRPRDMIHQSSSKRTRNETISQHQHCFNIEEDPKTFSEAMASRDVHFWKEAIQDEIDSIMHNNTWVLSDLPPGCKALGCKLTLKRKMKVDGTIDKYKARLVIQGFRQKEGIDFFDTYAPVTRISTIRLLLALGAIHNLVIHQMDVKTAFFNSCLDEEIYMKQPEGFVMPGNGHKVCKLKKSLYDDMLIFGTDLEEVDKTKKFLSSSFEMKDLEQAEVILGIRIKQGNNGISISQSHYIEKILKKFNFENCSPVSTPIDPSLKLLPNKGSPVSQLEYSRAIGCLMYAMFSTRLDIAYAVGRLSRYTRNPISHHWQDVNRVFKYLKGTMTYGLTYSGYPSILEGYSDASWINNLEDHSSTSGWVFLLGGGAISWASKKQTCITNSTMESEFVALSAAGKEAEWLRNLIYEIPLWPKPISTISIRCDSAATLAKDYSQVYNGKSRHLGVRHSMIRELIMTGVISVEFVRTQMNLADHLTKGLARYLVYKAAVGMDTQFPSNTTLDTEFNVESLIFEDWNTLLSSSQVIHELSRTARHALPPRHWKMQVESNAKNHCNIPGPEKVMDEYAGRTRVYAQRTHEHAFDMEAT
uniref:Zinc finger, CCHC-type n=1 Tax=Lactuca sativa TaxID=4236 RepID=A0A9R1V6D6_LACSA|nr:hypothetical protein LSAT_V11C600338430 [Lactuca sativa]